MDLLVELAKLGAVGIIGGFFGSFMANRNFRSQRWWERKADAYTRLIEALSDMLEYYSALGRAEIQGRELAEEQKAELEAHWNAGRRSVRKAANLGAFLLSPEVETALREFEEHVRKHHESYFEYLDESYGAVKACLETIVAQSKQDLQVRYFAGCIWRT
jgi:hypothetical protein